MEKSIVYLSDLDAGLFKLFLANYDTISKILTSGVLEVKGGSVTFNMDEKGIIRLIELKKTLFKL